MRSLLGSLGAWGEVIDPEPQNREWARLLVALPSMAAITPRAGMMLHCSE
jgi:hypothetical protein